MASPYPDGEREKVASKLPSALRQQLKVRAAELSIDIQDAVTTAIREWQGKTDPLPTVDTAGADSFSTWLPAGLYDQFKATCSTRDVSYTQGLAQSIRGWLDSQEGETPPDTGIPERKVVGNQKGGVGKTSVSAGIAEAAAEAGKTVLLVDFDPQGHLSDQLGVEQIGPGDDSLVTHMNAEGRGDIRDLLVTIEGERFGKRLQIIPACFDGFLLDAKLATNRVIRHKETALERALEPIESDFDVVVIDCPPSLGMAMDAAIYYARRRENERRGVSGMVIPVLAEDSSATAYTMLAQQIESIVEDCNIEVESLGLVVNLYDSRRGYVATSSLAAWKALQDPPVLAVIGDLKEQREAVRKVKPLLDYAPLSEQAEAMRQIWSAIS